MQPHCSAPSLKAGLRLVCVCQNEHIDSDMRPCWLSATLWSKPAAWSSSGTQPQWGSIRPPLPACCMSSADSLMWCHAELAADAPGARGVLAAAVAATVASPAAAGSPPRAGLPTAAAAAVAALVPVRPPPGAPPGSRRGRPSAAAAAAAGRGRGLHAVAGGSRHAAGALPHGGLRRAGHACGSAGGSTPGRDVPSGCR